MKRVLFILLMSLFGTNLLKAQMHGTTASMSVSITIVRSNSIGNVQNLNLTAPTTTSVSPNVSSYDGNAGKFKLMAHPGASVNINIPDEVTLRDHHGNVINIKTDAPVYNSNEDQKKARGFGDSQGGEARVSNTGSLYVWMGGKMLNKSVKSGRYLGTYTTTIEYN